MKGLGKRALALGLSMVMLITVATDSAWAQEASVIQGEEEEKIIEETVEVEETEAVGEITGTETTEVAETEMMEAVEEISETEGELAEETTGENATSEDTVMIEGIEYTYDSENNCYIVTGYDTEAESISASAFQDEIDGVPVTEIAELAFVYEDIDGYHACKSLTGELKLPSGLLKIGGGAFFGCTGLTGDLVIPDSVTVIENAVKLDSYSRLDWVNKGYNVYGDYLCGAFGKCGFTGSLKLSANLQKIGSGAFYGCTGLTGDLVIPDSVTVIEGDFCNQNISEGEINLCRGAFGKCGFTGSLTLSANLEEIGEGAFSQCGFTGELHIPNGVKTIGTGAFYGCTGFTGDLVIPDSVTVIEGTEDDTYAISNKYPGAFEQCGFTGSLTLSANLEEIGEKAFYQCSGFTGELHIPESVGTIGAGAFYQCSGFTGDLILPDKIENLQGGSFESCRGLNGTLKLPENLKTIESAVRGYHMVSNYGTGAYQIVATHSYEMGAFGGCNGFTGELKLPDTLTKIGNGTFMSCSGFTGELALPSGLQELGGGAFNGCSGFTGKVVLPQSLTEIGGDASDFDQNTRLRTGEYGVFAGCSGLTQITISKGMTGDIWNTALTGSIPIFVEAGNTKYASKDGILYDAGKTTMIACPIKDASQIKFPSTCTTIGSMACLNVSGNLVLPDGIQKIGKYAFTRNAYGEANCITIPKSVTDIDIKINEKENPVPGANYNGTLGSTPCVYKDSAAHNYVKENRYSKYIVIDAPEESTAKYLSSISASKTKTRYAVGDTLNTDDITVTAFYLDGTSETVTDYTIDTSAVDMTKAGSNTMTISYEKYNVTCTTTLTIQVSEKETEKETEEAEPGQETEQKQETWTVKFNANGGKKLSFSSINVVKNKAIGKLPTAQKKNYTLKGWYTKKSGGTKVTKNTKITKNQTLYAQWNKVSKPKKAQTPKLKSSKSGQLKVSFAKTSGAKGYEISYSASKKFTKKTTKTVNITSTSTTIKKLKKGKNYYVRVRAYKVDSAKNKIYGAYSAVKSIKVKK